MTQFLHEPAALNVPWIDSPFFEHQLATMDVPEEWKQQARRFRRDGYVVLDDVVDPDLVRTIVAEYPRLFDPSTRFGVDPELERLLKVDPRRRQDAWRVSTAIRRLACHEPILERLRFLYQRAPIPFQTLNFLPGSEQPAHSDAIHFNTIPAGFMAGVWIALEDVDDENGPLIYYPGSHRLPDVRLEHLRAWSEAKEVARGPNYERYEEYVKDAVETLGIEAKRFTAPAGTAVVWASNLLHGGDVIRDPSRTRMSQVIHFFFEDCVYYTPINSDACLGELRLRRVYDIARDREMPHRLNGRDLKQVKMPNGTSRVALPEEVSGPELVKMIKAAGRGLLKSYLASNR